MEIGMVFSTGAPPSILAINTNGLRSKKEKALLGKSLGRLQMGFCIITETHIRPADESEGANENYHAVAD